MSQRKFGATALCLLLITAWFFGFSGGQAVRAENRALLVGVGQYKDPQNSLPGIDMDVEMMRESALLMGFTDSQIKVVRDSDATLRGIEEAFENWLIQGVTENDRVLFYFSGHGSQISDQSHDEKDGVDEVLVAHDASSGRGTLENTLIDDKFGEYLSRIPSKEIFVLIDACHSGSATKKFRNLRKHKGISRNWASKFFIYKGMPEGGKGSYKVEATPQAEEKYIGLSACMDEEVALATEKGSLFTLGVRTAMKDASQKPDKQITMQQLQESTSVFIEGYAPQGNRHHPQMSGNKALARKNLIFKEKPVIPSARQGITSETSTATDSTSAAPMGIWEQLEDMVRQASSPVDIQINQERFKIGDLLVITCHVENEGYLNILNICRSDKEATVLYPNKYHSENHVTAGTTITIPDPGDKFRLRTHPPAEENLIAVFLTQEDINAHRDGQGDIVDLFRTLSTKGFTRGFKDTLRGFKAEYKDFGAGLVKTYVEEWGVGSEE